MLKPFKGIRFKKNTTQNGIPPISLPYDKITPEQYEKYIRNPYNIARIILPGGFERRDYQLAKLTYEEFIQQGVLKIDHEPGYYIYQVEFEVGGRKYKRTHVIGILRLPEDGESYVFPHERTFPKVVEDRLNLLRATQVNFGQVFLLTDSCRDFKSFIEGEPEIYTLDGEVHSVWYVRRQDIEECFRNSKFVIADGHHRFKTALLYRDEMRKKHGHEGPYTYRMVTVTSIYDPGVVILATHRAVSWKVPIPRNAKKFAIIDELKKFIEDNKRSIGIITEDGIFGLLYDEELTGPEYLEINFLRGSREVRYFREIEEGISMLKSSEAGTLFILNPPSVETVWKYAVSGKLLPEKSTDFYPKVPTGLVMFDLKRSV